MQYTELNRIPHPTIDTDPFWDEFLEFANYMDTASEGTWLDVDTFEIIDTELINFVIDDARTRWIRSPGRPFRWRAGPGYGWSYGILNERGENIIGRVTGDPLFPEVTELQFGSFSLVETVQLRVPGNYNFPGVTYSQYFQNVLGLMHKWHGPPARVVGVAMSNRVSDSGVDPTIYATGPFDEMAYALTMDEQLPDFRFAQNSEMREPLNRTIGFGDTLDFRFSYAGSNNNAQDLVITYYLIKRGPDDAVCPDTENPGSAADVPQLVFTITGIPPGDNFIGFTEDGTYEVCPLGYNWEPPYGEELVWGNPAPGTAGTGAGVLEMAAFPPPHDTVSFAFMEAFVNGSTYTQGFPYPPGITNEPWLHDRLFTTFTLGPVSVSVARGDGTWGEDR